MRDATATRCSFCASRFPPSRPRAWRRAVCPRCGGPLAAGALLPRPQPRDLDSVPDDPAALRRIALWRGVREAGLLLSLVAVMTTTAYYVWQGLRDTGPAPPEILAEHRAATRAEDVPARPPGAAPPSRIIPRDPTRFGRATPGLDPESSPPDPAGQGPSSPVEAGIADDPGPIPPETPPGPPTLQVPEDAPRQPIRLLSPDLERDLARIPDLPALRAPIDLSGLAPSPAPPTDSPAPEALDPAADSRHLLVGDDSGRVLVCRLYAEGPQGPIVQLPDGSLGWPESEVRTDRPFEPWDVRQVSRALRNGRYRDFRAIEREPYLVLTEGTDKFAEQTADLLQALYRDLIACLEEGEIPVTAPEFPLVVIIYRDEVSFREYQQVDPDVRAYYEVASNRIILHESSQQDRRSPELAALSRPQTIAHEGVHQILQNTGVQPRLSHWPTWLVEGLAEYYAPTAFSGPVPEGSPSWGDYGRANFGRVNPLHMATLIDLQDPSALLAHLRGPGPGPNRPAWARLGPEEPWVAHLILRDEFSPTDYALAWCLTHYLAHRHPEALRSYILSLGQRPPLRASSPEQHLKEFVSAFGLHPSTVARRIDRHLASLRYERVPYYAVRFEQPMPSGLTRRGTLVSPSPTMISQWLQAQTLADGGPLLWWADRFPSRNRARLFCESWLLHPFP